MAKLLMITGLGSAKDLASGRQGAFYNTLSEFRKYWDRIDVISPKVNNPRENIFENVFTHPSPWRLIFFHPLFFIYKILNLSRKINFDLMTVQDYPPFYNGIGAWIVSVFTKTPYVLEIHHISGYPKVANFKEKIYSNLFLWRFYWHFFGSRALAVRVVNQNQTPAFLKKVGVQENKIIYVPSMYIDLDVFRPMDLAKKYDVIFIGRLEANKGINLLFQAIKIIKTSNPDFKVKIIGDGSLRKVVDENVTLFKDSVDYSGGFMNREDMVRCLNESKMLVMPSYNEGGPRVVVEAMACGVPVLATNVGLIPDFAHKNAVKIIDWDAEDIAKKVKELLENENERKRLSEAGMEIAKQFEKKKMIENYANELHKLIK